MVITRTQESSAQVQLVQCLIVERMESSEKEGERTAQE